MQKFLLHLQQFFCQCIAEANWKILNLPLHFIAYVLSTWISKGENSHKTYLKCCPSDQRKNIACFRLNTPVRFFFPTMRLVNFFRKKKRIKKTLNRKRKLKNEKWDQLKKKKMSGHSSSLTFFIYIYKSKIHMFQLMQL